MPVAARVLAAVKAHAAEPFYFHELALSPAELQAVLDAMRAGGFKTIDDFLRVAAAKLVMHLDVRMPRDAFQLSSRKFT